MKMFSKPLLAISCLVLATAARPATSTYTTPNLDDNCTFVLWHRQQDAASYIQLNTILDHANDITIDIASQRPATSHNSYTRIDQQHAFAVTGLLDDSSLSISYSGQDELAFEVGAFKWTSRDAYIKEDSPETAWCNASVWEGSDRRRERRLDCAFPCEKITDEEIEVEYGVAQNGGWQEVVLMQ